MRFRPNRPRGPRRRGIMGGLLAAGLMSRLAAANRHLEAGRAVEAADEFAQLAQEASARSQPRRAVQLHLRAGEAYAQAGRGEQALAQARAAIAIIRSVGGDWWATRMMARIVEGLRRAGLTAEAETLERELAGFAPSGEEESGPPMPARGRLPTHCPQCGGPLRSDEVEWIDDHTAECPFCGSAVRTE